MYHIVTCMPCRMVSTASRTLRSHSTISLARCLSARGCRCVRRYLNYRTARRNVQRQALLERRVLVRVFLAFRLRFVEELAEFLLRRGRGVVVHLFEALLHAGELRELGGLALRDLVQAALAGLVRRGGPGGSFDLWLHALAGDVHVLPGQPGGGLGVVTRRGAVEALD